MGIVFLVALHQHIRRGRKELGAPQPVGTVLRANTPDLDLDWLADVSDRIS